MRISNLLIISLFICNPGFSKSPVQKFALATVIQSHMVVQQDKPFKIWGKAVTGDKISITADWQINPVKTVADAKGDWIAEIVVPKVKAGDFTAHQITITHKDSTVKLTHILIGEVWVCSGQSNMEMTMLPAPPWHKGVMDYEKEIPEASYPNIRLFKIKRDTSSAPTIFCEAKWEACSPKTIGQFSGVAYYFGRELYKKINLPIGLVLSSYGGASCQAFTAKEVLENDSLLKRKYLDPYLADPAKVQLTNKPSLMYNQMIYPLINLSVKGFLWYQGESNSGDKQMYTRLCTAMLTGWRSDFKQGDLPFYFVQMTPYNWKKDNFLESNYAVFREAQEAMLGLKNTAMAVTMGVGDPTDIHPRKKKEVGLRLAKIAISKSYNLKNVPYKGPQFKSFKVTNGQILLSFFKESVAMGLATTDGLSPKHFYIAGKDQVFAEAEARILGNQIILFSSKVKDPVAVRYAFLNYPITNFKNKAGLPAFPFRTDNWENITYK